MSNFTIRDAVFAACDIIGGRTNRKDLAIKTHSLLNKFGNIPSRRALQNGVSLMTVSIYRAEWRKQHHEKGCWDGCGCGAPKAVPVPSTCPNAIDLALVKHAGQVFSNWDIPETIVAFETFKNDAIEDVNEKLNKLQAGGFDTFEQVLLALRFINELRPAA